MKYFPETALTSLEFDKIQSLLISLCRTDAAREMVMSMRIHTSKLYIENALHQTYEYKSILDAGDYFPNDFVHSIKTELKLLSIHGSTLNGEQFILLAKLAENTETILRWFNAERKEFYPHLFELIKEIAYEKNIRKQIDVILEPNGIVRDNASNDLWRIRMALQRKRNEVRREFDRMIGKLQKQGYLSDIEESFMNGRRVVAVFAEHKRTVRGVLHSESDSGKTCFIEPEETMPLNNEVITLENEEHIEINRILRQLTDDLRPYAPLLEGYRNLSVLYDFISAKARLGREMNGQLPLIVDKAIVKLLQAKHPLLYLHNQKVQKQTIPVDLDFDEEKRILVISGPNAGGKTVTMKTMGLLQVMMQSGLLVPVAPDSTMGIFKLMMIHIGDTQSIEFELSTYTSHLLHMKHFVEHANGKTLFFIDELGGGSDPNLGGAFAEAILEELGRKHAIGIVTTHYLNLKIMAGKTRGVFNGAMQFDEANMKPLYQLKTGSPGSSYTFSIADRIGMDKRLINRAKQLADTQQYHLEKLLNQTERDLQQINKERLELKQLLEQNEKLKKGMQELMRKEQHYQEMEKLKLSNQIQSDKIEYLKDTERKLKALMHEWRKSEDKDEVIRQMHLLFSAGKDRLISNKQAKRTQALPEAIKGEIGVGSYVRLGQTRQIGVVKEIKGKNALLQVGNMPMTTAINNLVLVREPEKT